MNEIATRKPAPIQKVAPPNVGVYDDFDTFEKAYTMAKALSKTELIPANFRGKPEDCLIAIDWARRLNVAPMAIMPHLFCIKGRPATSAQFKIALVNRSGRFSRVAWTEGVDGKITYADERGAKVETANFYAEAYFTELATGREIRSSRVDMKIALLSGWLTKGQDKGVDSMWKKSPQLMLRYRSASALISTTCPEITLGLDTAEDVYDNVDTRTYQAEVVVRDDEPAPKDAIDQIIDAIEAAETLEALEALGNDIGHANFSEDQLARLRPAFLTRQGELKQALDGQGTVE